jgi:hypothetical protein
VRRHRRLRTIAAEQTGLGLPTIMDRAVAAAHGVDYVHLAVCAIDVDRVYWLDPKQPGLTFGWEVFLTEWLLLSRLDRRSPSHLDLIEAMCWPLVADAPGEPRLGGQIVFAVYDAVQRGALPKGLEKLFVGWRSPPRELLLALQALREPGRNTLHALCHHCLEAELSPPLAPPTREALLQIQSGVLAPPDLDSAPTE